MLPAGSRVRSKPSYGNPNGVRIEPTAAGVQCDSQLTRSIADALRTVRACRSPSREDGVVPLERVRALVSRDVTTSAREPRAALSVEADSARSRICLGLGSEIGLLSVKSSPQLKGSFVSKRRR